MVNRPRFNDMHRVPTGKLDPSFLSKLLQICIDGKAKKQCHSVHQLIISVGLGSDLTLNTRLIIFYSKIGDMAYAQKMFDTTPDRNIVSWAALLSGYSRNGCPGDALLVFREMRHSGLRGNQFTYGSAFKACTQLLCLRHGRQIQGCVNKSRFAMNLFVQSALLDLYSKCGNLDDAAKIFDGMSDRDLVSWNSIIGGYAVNGMAEGSFRMFQSMLKEGFSPDRFTFGSLLNACVVGKHLPKVSEVHGFMTKLGLGLHNLLLGLLIDAYAKCGDLKLARRVFMTIPAKDAFSCTNLITAYSREGIHASDAFDLFCEIHRVGIRIDDVLLCSIVNLCASTVSLAFGRQIHAILVKSHPGFDVAMGNALIDMYGKSGALRDSIRTFAEMDAKNVVSWSSMIATYAKHGRGYEAIELFRMMESQGLRPNDITFLSILFACSHSGLTDEGLRYFNTMVSEYNIVPRERHFSCVIDLFARGGKLDEAFCLMKEMNIHPNAALWNSILGASNVHGSLSTGEVAASNLLNLDPENSSSYVILANMYAALGLWNEAESTHLLMDQRSLKKCPGFSYLHRMNYQTRLLEG